MQQGAGVGGISRGGSPTGLLWGDESRGDLDQFESKLLPPGQALDLESSATIGLGTDVPEVAPVAEGAGLVDVEGATGKATWRRRLHPRHRDAVSEFFKAPTDED
ncbi:MAG: hypothetical protein H6831_01110 [Planctomycetes bacterium]|nr:hypothetical protein [Planctomycetota bacterium]